MIEISRVERNLLSFNRKLVKKYKGNQLPPATCIGGIFSRWVSINYSHKLTGYIPKQLNIELLKLGPIGHSSKVCNNKIGSCCEVHVTIDLIQKHPIKNTVPLKKIEFTRARRPRTNQYIKRCPNCVNIFGNEK